MDLNKAIIQQFTPAIGGTVLIARISRVIAQLEEETIEGYRVGHSLERAHQLACADILFSHLLQAELSVHRNSDGAPYLKGYTENISISHTDDFMAVYLHTSEQVAIDIELMGRDISAVQHRFANQEELGQLAQATSKEPLLQLWSIKECLFKVIPVSQVLFKQHLMLQSAEYDGNRWLQRCIVNHPAHRKEYSVVSRIFAPLIVSYTVVRSSD
jgi:phosphopantetheinyl transferase